MAHPLPGSFIASIAEHITRKEDGTFTIEADVLPGLLEAIASYASAEDQTEIPNDKVLVKWFQCAECLKELIALNERTGVPQSPRAYNRFEVGFTRIGLQVWCIRHDRNVAHINFEGFMHPANLT